MLAALVSSPTKQERAAAKLTRDQGFALQELENRHPTITNRPERLEGLDTPPPRTVRGRT
jgi:hypothetical protein